ncbi:hypothetical protein MRB53_007217 [Persea americana]|uniref:Uncharacterized protein n=1 Tax=Persea americana TaxID=3435 RepID=A0ACC2MIK9_PERAE|nr:hypothetical protein MRB53_007217 [Persea americana]
MNPFPATFSDRPIYLLIFFFLVSVSTVRSATELQILLDFKSQLSNPPSLSSWRTDTPPCNFSGISCNSAGSVTQIQLSKQNLAGPLPIDSLCNLPFLQNLSLGSNLLSGPLKPEINNCSRLQVLDLASNNLFGSVPDLSSLGLLQDLNLSCNGFSGPFPWNSLVNLTNLVALSLGDNPALQRSRFPEEILQLKKLSWLYLTNSSLEGEIPPLIGNLTALVNLELSHNYFVGQIPSEIMKLSELRQLELWGNLLSGRIPAGFGNLTELQFFDASKNHLVGDLEEIRHLSKVVSLQLFENGLSGEIPPEFGEFKELVNLSLYGNNLTGSLPEKIGSWSEFDFIDVSDNHLTGPIPPDMCKQGKMTELLLLGNYFSGGIPPSYAECKSLTRLRVNQNSLSGRVPDGIWGLPNMEIIDLTGNGFEGPVTSDISGAGKLAELYISNNRFSGELPKEISRVPNLNLIVAGFNEFSGEIPSTIGELKSLARLLLQENKLSGGIPDSLASCAVLHEINLAGNSLTGQIPASLGFLQTLNSLNLSSNQLSGEIPVTLSALKLSLLDLSDNQLSGSVPNSLSFGAYGDGFSGNPELCSSRIRYLRRCSSDSQSHSGHLKTLIPCFLAGSALVLFSFGCYVFIKKRRCDQSEQDWRVKDSWDLKSFRALNFTEQEILSSIKQENLIGKGGSGNVYRVVLGNGKQLAVKHVWNSGPGDGKSTTAMLRRYRKMPEFDAEVATLSSIRHVNVVQLYCSITSEDSSLLVYEYLPNGSLWDRLHTCRKVDLDWGTRYEIALGAAKGLEYLHHGCERPVIHRDVKSSNILLDEFFKPRIADFGLAKIVQANAGRDSTQVIAGTYGYIAPGKRPIEPEFGENKDIVFWVSSQLISKESMLNLVDSHISGEVKENAYKVLRIALLCTAKLPALRPSMRAVVQMLEDAGPNNLIAITIKDEKGSGSFEQTMEMQKQCL